MSLNMYIGEVKSQTQSMNTFCTATIQGMEQAINSIDAFANDVMLQGKTYDSAKLFLMQTYRPLAQGIIYLCEELIRQNDAFPSDFQSEVATVDVIEHEILNQIREIDRTIASMEAISENMPGMLAMLQMYHAMRQRLQKKLERLYEFNQSSSDNYSTALQLASSIAQGLAEVSNKGFHASSGTFSTQELNMDWAKSIQEFAERKAREAKKLNSTTASEKVEKPFEGGYDVLKGSIKTNTEGRYRTKIEGSLVEGKYKTSEKSKVEFKAGNVKVEGGLPYTPGSITEDLFTGKIIGGKGGFTGFEGTTTFDTPYTEVSLTQKNIDASVAYGIDEYTFKQDAELTIHKYEVKLDKIDIPDFIPFIGEYDIEIRGELGLGTFGYKLHAGQETGAYIGAGKVGGGVFAKFKKQGEEE